MLSKRHLCADNLHVCVLDEADEMLSRGFKNQIFDIFSFLPADIQACLFSAAMTPAILELTVELTRDVVPIMGEADDEDDGFACAS